MAELTAAAQPVWAAYETMEGTKQRHFVYLQALENKYEKYGQPNAEEKARLAELLAVHDTAVKQFKVRLSQLRISDPTAYGTLIKRLSEQV